MSIATAGADELRLTCKLVTIVLNATDTLLRYELENVTLNVGRQVTFR